MNPALKNNGALLLALVLSTIAVVANCRGQSTNSQTTNAIWIVEAQGRVEVSPVGATTWVLTQTNQPLYPADRVRTGPNSRVALRWSDQTVVPFGASTELEILPPHEANAQAGLRLLRGIVSFLHRDTPGRFRVLTRGAVAGIEGTEFVIEVKEANGGEQTVASVIDGQVRLSNESGLLVLTNGDQAIATAGQPPRRTAGFVANNLLQWSFYYPAVLDVQELQLSDAEQQLLQASLEAYRSGDLLAALAKYPESRTPASDSERVYHAGLQLAVGGVEATSATLATLGSAPDGSRSQRLSGALRTVISAVKLQPDGRTAPPQLASELLAASYWEQSQAARDVSLRLALELARQAVTNSPDFGFAWERVAELEFSFGRIEAATQALDRGLALAPRNAQAIALKGYLLAGRNQPREAIAWFERALAIDAALGNAWLGRGLCRIRSGDAAGGREDLLVAAALEPQRAVLRSYLGKAYANVHDYPHAEKELGLAKHLDPHDPTAWQYSALLHQERNEINDAIRDLEKAQALNDNRSVYRSQLLLDQDRSVRSANLASIYQDAGLDEVAVREASRAVNYDYANYSAHLFLANSYNSLKDPNLINLRFETAGQTEYLLANLLAPASAGTFAPSISQQEYSRLFEQNRFGVISATEYLSRGAWTESGAQYGVLGDFSYNVESFYHFDPGQRFNDEETVRYVAVTAKEQVTPRDMVFLRVDDLEREGGDLAQYYSPASANPTFHIHERQEPNVYLGYHHEWNPGVHTLFLASRVQDVSSFGSLRQPTQLVSRDPDDAGNFSIITALAIAYMHEHWVNHLVNYSSELQQIWETPTHTTILGFRAQFGRFHTENEQDSPAPPFTPLFPVAPEPAAVQDFSSSLNRFSGYAYHQWHLTEDLQLVGGLSYDNIRMPENFLYAPISDGEHSLDQISPKAGLIWSRGNSTLRFGYSQSLSGASLDQSQQLEPSQVAGILQSFRSAMPESVVGGTSGNRIETGALSLEQKFPTGTFLGVSLGVLNSKVDRELGAFDTVDDGIHPYGVPSKQGQGLRFHEQFLNASAHQLLGRDLTVGASFAISRDLLKVNYEGDTPTLAFSTYPPAQRGEATLKQLRLFATLNHPSGLFATSEAHWYSQNNEGGLADSKFWQFNLLAGYRFCHRRASVALGLLNVGDQDYQLNPLNYLNDLPRRRTLLARFQLNF